MRSPLNSRTNSRPVPVAADEAFVFVAWITAMTCPFLSELSLDVLQRQIATASCQVQRMSHFLFFDLQVGQRMRGRADLAGKPFGDLDAAFAERPHFARVIGQQANA